MTELRATNRAMFWRIIRRLLSANRGRLFVMLLALGAGAAVTAALLNLQVDAKRRLVSEFRVFGANVVIAPRNTPTNEPAANLVNQSILQRIPSEFEGHSVAATPFLYLVADATSDFSSEGKPVHLVVAGTTITNLPLVGPGWKFDLTLPSRRPGPPTFYVASGTGCMLGVRAANKLGHFLALPVTLHNGKQSEQCEIVSVLSSGGTEDSQIFIDLSAAQHLATLSSRISLIQLNVDGTPSVIERFVTSLRQEFPDVEIHGRRSEDLQPHQRVADGDGWHCAVADGAVRDGGDDERGNGTEDGRGLDESHRRSDAARAAVVSCRGGAAGARGRLAWRWGRHFSVDWTGKSCLWRSGAAETDCVSCSCGADHARRYSERVSATAAGEYPSGIGFSR